MDIGDASRGDSRQNGDEQSTNHKTLLDKGWRLVNRVMSGSQGMAFPGPLLGGSVNGKRFFAVRFARTAAGELALNDAAQALSPQYRDLLQAIDAAHPVSRCVEAVPGARLSDAMRLGLLALIERCRASSDALDADEMLWERVVAFTLELPRERLYTLMTRQATARLGLIHGFRLVLALERAADHADLQALALRFLEATWRSQGMEGLAAVEREGDRWQ